MSSYDELIGILKHLLLDRFVPKPSFIKGVLGDGVGRVEVDNRKDFAYARFNRNSTAYFEIFNKNAPYVDNWPVLIGEFFHQPGLTQVVGTDWEAYYQAGWGDDVSTTGLHAPTHEWRDQWIGSDPLSIYMRSIAPARGYSLTGTSVYVNSFEYFTGTIWPGLPGVDLSPAIGALSTGSARFMGVYVNYDNTLGVVTGSSSVDTLAFDPPLVQFPWGTIPIARVRTYGGQGTVREADYRDARQLFGTSVKASQTEVNSGIIDTKYVTPTTLKNTPIDHLKVSEIWESDGGAVALEADAAGNLTATGNITMSDDKWIGLGSAAGRIAFDATTTPDLVQVLDARLTITLPSGQSIALIAKGTNAAGQVNFEVENDAAADTANSINQNFVLQTSTARRSASNIKASLSTTTDASRTGLLELQVPNAGSFATRLAIAGNKIGIGTTAPQGIFHVLETDAGHLIWRGATINATPQVIIANGTGDVTEVVQYSYVVKDSSGDSTSGTNSNTPGGAAVTITTLAGNTIDLSVAASGEFSVVRSAGTRTFTLIINAIWL